MTAAIKPQTPLYGADAIGAHLGMSRAKVYEIRRKANPPIFNIAGVGLAAFPASLDKWLADLEAAGGNAGDTTGGKAAAP